MRTIVSAVMVAAMVMALTGCATYQHQAKSIELNQRAKLYVKAIRWSDFGSALAMIRVREGAAAKVDLEAFKGIRVTSDNHQLAAVDKESEEATMSAVFEYHLANSATVKRVVQNVQWWYDPEVKTWFIDGTLPAF